MLLITGGTGYLGKSLAARFLKYEPQSIRIFSRDEVKHFQFNNLFENNPKFRNLIGDVRDYDRIVRATEGVDILIHAAALKRIDILEYNVTESIKTNILGSLNVANAVAALTITKAGAQNGQPTLDEAAKLLRRHQISIESILKTFKRRSKPKRKPRDKKSTKSKKSRRRK